MFRRLGQTLVMLTLFMAASAPALAQGYLGVGLGANFYNDADTIGIEEDSTAFEVKGGMRLADVLALEMSYLNLVQQF